MNLTVVFCNERVILSVCDCVARIFHYKSTWKCHWKLKLLACVWRSMCDHVNICTLIVSTVCGNVIYYLLSLFSHPVWFLQVEMVATKLENAPHPLHQTALSLNRTVPHTATWTRSYFLCLCLLWWSVHYNLVSIGTVSNVILVICNNML